MIRALLVQALRQRARLTAIVAADLLAIAFIETALFPALRHSIGDVGSNLPKGVADLIGGGNFATLPGWLKVEVFSIVAPFTFAGIGIVIAVAGTAGDEESGVLDLVLAHPVRRAQLVLATACAAVAAILVTAFALWGGLVIGVHAFTDGGLGAGALAAAIVHAALLGIVFAAFGLAVAAATGSRSTAIGVAVAVAAGSYLVDGFTGAIASISWIRRLTPFYYDNANDPLSHGVDAAHLAVLAGLSLLLAGAAVVAFDRRDIRG